MNAIPLIIKEGALKFVMASDVLEVGEAEGKVEEAATVEEARVIWVIELGATLEALGRAEETADEAAMAEEAVPVTKVAVTTSPVVPAMEKALE